MKCRIRTQFQIFIGFFLFLVNFFHKKKILQSHSFITVEDIEILYISLCRNFILNELVNKYHGEWKMQKIGLWNPPPQNGKTTFDDYVTVGDSSDNLV